MTYINVRVDEKIKEQAEKIYEELGITMSAAINVFLKQTIRENGLPFELKLNHNKPLSFASLDENQFNSIISSGFDEYVEGKILTSEQVKTQMKKDFGV